MNQNINLTFLIPNNLFMEILVCIPAKLMQHSHWFLHGTLKVNTRSLWSSKTADNLFLKMLQVQHCFDTSNKYFSGIIKVQFCNVYT